MSIATSELVIPDLTDGATFHGGVPHAAFDAIRRMPGLYWQPAAYATQNGGFWAVTRYADIIEIERQPDLFTSTKGPAFPSTNLPENSARADQLMMMDPPRHSGVRRAAASAFGPRVVANFDPWVRAIVVEALDAVEAAGEFDWVTEVAAIIPSMVIARVMGVPHADRMFIVDNVRRIFEIQELADNDSQSTEVREEMFSYIVSTLEPAVARGQEDNMAWVLNQAVERGDMTRSESRHFLRLLITAGFETTHTLIGQTMRTLLEQPEIASSTSKAMDELGADRVIDEFLRLITPAMNMARTATRDTEIAGQPIREGDLMQMYFVAANRDPEVFADPHEFNPWREGKTGLSFGSGAHRCMGAALAKLEMRILFEELRRRRLKLRPAGEPVRGHSVFINALASLPVAVAGPNEAGVCV